MAGAIQTAVAVRGGDVRGVVFHSDKGSEYTADLFEGVCERLGITQSMGRVGSCFDCDDPSDEELADLGGSRPMLAGAA